MNETMQKYSKPLKYNKKCVGLTVIKLMQFKRYLPILSEF